MRYSNPYKLLLPMVLAFLLNALPVKSQNLIGFSPNALSGWRDTVYVGDSVWLAGLLKNYSTTNPFTDTLMLAGTVDTGATTPVPFSVIFPQQIFIGPTDSIPLVFSFLFDTAVVGAPQFHVGNNVVVVWPIGLGPGGWQPRDSLNMNVLVLDTMSSIGPEPDPPFLNIYPIPNNGPLFITSFNPQYQINYVIIRDAMGQTVYEGVPTNQSISTEGWSRGLYTVEAALSNGTVSWYKIMRQ